MPERWKWMIIVPIWSSAVIAGIAAALAVGKQGTVTWGLVFAALIAVLFCVILIAAPLLILIEVIEKEIEKE